MAVENTINSSKPEKNARSSKNIWDQLVISIAFIPFTTGNELDQTFIVSGTYGWVRYTSNSVTSASRNVKQGTQSIKDCCGGS